MNLNHLILSLGDQAPSHTNYHSVANSRVSPVITAITARENGSIPSKSAAASRPETPSPDPLRAALEVGQQYSTFTFPATAPLLLLAGDIGRLIDYDAYRAFLEAQVARYDKVLLVLGDHEFHGLDYESGVAAARRLAREPSLAGGLALLLRARWDDDDPRSDFTVLGCTLWSAVPEDARAVVEAKGSDCRRIRGWSAQRHHQLRPEEVAWLRDQVARVRNAAQGGAGGRRRLLVATHHAPCVEGTSQPDQVGNPWTCASRTTCWRTESDGKGSGRGRLATRTTRPGSRGTASGWCRTSGGMSFRGALRSRWETVPGGHRSIGLMLR